LVSGLHLKHGDCPRHTSYIALHRPSRNLGRPPRLPIQAQQGRAPFRLPLPRLRHFPRGHPLPPPRLQPHGMGTSRQRQDHRQTPDPARNTRARLPQRQKRLSSKEHLDGDDFSNGYKHRYCGDLVALHFLDFLFDAS
jgi:hypothetical protein